MYWLKIKDVREGEVAIVGVVLNVVENYLILDDGTSKARVYYDRASEFKPKDIVLAVGSVITSSAEFKEIQGYAIANISGIDISLLRDVEEVRREVEKKLEGGDDGE
ncbi:MAG TPA: hypothetical protein ENF57_00140 [Candidatus Korarchaeota archaeon]|nr:hypothetical protein [Candidatus Korarchaeota archaeon]HDI73403.1 hypothetical protein [Candidatus Korarchaeota archaeon]